LQLYEDFCRDSLALPFNAALLQPGQPCVKRPADAAGSQVISAVTPSPATNRLEIVSKSVNTVSCCADSIVVHPKHTEIDRQDRDDRIVFFAAFESRLKSASPGCKSLFAMI
jgi:hypothetical protein